MTKHLWIGLIGLSSLFGCATPPAPEPPSEPVVIQPNSFMRQWRTDLQVKRGKVEHLFVRDNLVFAYTDQHSSYVLDRDTGAVRRLDNVARPNVRIFPPLVDRERIVYPTHTTLEIYSRNSDEHRSIKLGESVSTPAVMEGDMVFLGIDHAGGGRIMAADISKDYGVKAWEVMTLGGLLAAPALHSNILYFGAEDGHVYAVTDEREQAWPLERSRFDARGRIISDVMVDDYGVYATVSNGTVYALDRSNGKVKWQFFAPRGLRGHIVPGATLAYLYVPGEGIVAIDKFNGLFTRKAKWTVAEGRQVLSEDADRVYLRGEDNSILAVNKQTGKIVFQSARNDYQIFATNMSAPTIYAATRDGRAFAITPVTRPGMMGHIALVEQPLLLDAVQ